MNQEQIDKMRELAHTLHEGAAADIWFESFDESDDEDRDITYAERIELTQSAMVKAGDLLNRLAVIFGDQIEWQKLDSLKTWLICFQPDEWEDPDEDTIEDGRKAEDLLRIIEQIELIKTAPAGAQGATN